MSLNLVLEKIPHEAIPLIQKWTEHYAIKWVLKGSRKSKLGDYRFLGNQSHQITINKNLDSYAFFFVITHEIAHLLTFTQTKKRLKPHGKEWKLCFGNLILKSIHIYPETIHSILLNHAKSPKANLYSDPNLYLQLFHDKENSVFRLEDLELGGSFIIGGREFIKLEKRKIRYLCKEISTQEKYFVSGMAIVEKLNT